MAHYATASTCTTASKTLHEHAQVALCGLNRIVVLSARESYKCCSFRSSICLGSNSQVIHRSHP